MAEEYVCGACEYPPNPRVKTKQMHCRICQRTTTHWKKEINPLEPRRGVVTWNIFEGTHAHHS